MAIQREYPQFAATTNAITIYEHKMIVIKAKC